VFDRLRNNLGLKAISLVLAVSAWAYLRFASNPIITAHFEQQLVVPVTTVGLGQDLVARYGEHQAVVGAVVPRDGTVRPEMLRTVLDLEGKGPGVYNVPLQVIAPKLEIHSLTPATVTLAIERIEERRFPVTIRYTGDPHGTVVDGTSVVPSDVVLRGATSDLARVAGVRVEFPIGPAASRIDEMLRPQVEDSHGAEVGGVDLSPNLVRVRADFTQPAK
jgi:YbbR domain-containing protein